MQITIDITDSIAVIGMDDGKKNAIDFAAIDNLNTAMDEADMKASAIVLAGRSGSFCAGFNLAIMTGDDQEAPRGRNVEQRSRSCSNRHTVAAKSRSG